VAGTAFPSSSRPGLDAGFALSRLDIDAAEAGDGEALVGLKALNFPEASDSTQTLPAVRDAKAVAVQNSDLISNS
jgi:hypothetical protein